MHDDSSITELFFDRSEQAISYLDEKYGRLCMSIARGILKNDRDAEECVNDAYLGVWNAIPPARPSSLRAFLCRIVRSLSLKRYSANTARKRNSIYDTALDELSECLASSETVESELDSRELTRHIEGFLDTLSPENRAIFISRYWLSETYEQTAERVGISVKNVSVRLTRLRRQLRKYLEERGIIV